ncbi:hypothetical protein ACFOUP_16305 [Belliella kenyensis]|uniref:Uncharacterized protein n=1 Tax=Belliella kenyensis TaxID=1472724 RepID=A0ABV8ES29_9BACT|nr:hypothetical protein [Belliella kenyensis]MCH7401829.1 hypothetical protein [Belliella kenyensis]MDN3604329.1 hypothetical protein [Belliella kenyensis]
MGHSQITDLQGKPIIDWEPTERVGGFGDWVQGTNSYERGVSIPASKMKWNSITIKGVNTSRTDKFSNMLNQGNGKYNLAVNSCVSMTSRALNVSGVFNVGILPYLLHEQMYLRGFGVSPYLFSHHLY